MPINDAYFKKKYGQRNEDQVFVWAICRHLLRSCEKSPVQITNEIFI